MQFFISKMTLPEIEEILQKYKPHEDKVEKSLKEQLYKEERLKSAPAVNNEFLNLQEVKERNKKLLSDFEAAKGRLRSKAIYCPTEVQWENICRRYQENPSLPATTWKCHIPVYV